MIFSHILADAEVISIDAFVKKPNGVIIGVTLVKVCTMRYSVYNIELNVELFIREIQIPKSSTSISMVSTVSLQTLSTGTKSLVHTHTHTTLHFVFILCSKHGLSNKLVLHFICSFFLFLCRGLASTASQLHSISAHTHTVSPPTVYTPHIHYTLTL